MNVTILGKEYLVRELSLAQKNKIMHDSGIDEILRNAFKHVFVKKNGKGSLSFDCDDEIGLDSINADSLILSSIDALPELLALAIPDFTDWDNLPESQSRSVLLEVVKLQDFGGYIGNFLPLVMAVFTR